MILAQATCDLSADSLAYVDFAIFALQRSITIGLPVWTVYFALRVVRRIASA